MKDASDIMMEDCKAIFILPDNTIPSDMSDDYSIAITLGNLYFFSEGMILNE